MQYDDAVDNIEATLGEDDDQTRAQVAAIVDALGDQVALDLLDETVHIEGNGGMLASDGSRRRTPTGIFFQLVRPRLSPVQRRAIFEDLPQSVRRGQRPAPAPPMPLRASSARVAPNGVDEPATTKAQPPALQSTTAPVQKLVLLHDVLPARNNGSAQRDAEPSNSEELMNRGSKRRARLKANRAKDPEADSQAPTEPPPAAVPTTRDDLDGASESSFADRVRVLVDDFVADLVPMLRESVMEKIRGALGGLDNGTPDGDRPALARAPTATKRRRRRRGSTVSTRLLAVVRRRPGIALNELALELYGEDGPTREGRNRARTLARRLASEGRLRFEGGKYELF